VLLRAKAVAPPREGPGAAGGGQKRPQNRAFLNLTRDFPNYVFEFFPWALCERRGSATISRVSISPTWRAGWTAWRRRFVALEFEARSIGLHGGSQKAARGPSISALAWLDT
jgi:hypothetical protein